MLVTLELMETTALVSDEFMAPYTDLRTRIGKLFQNKMTALKSKYIQDLQR